MYWKCKRGLTPALSFDCGAACSHGYAIFPVQITRSLLRFLRSRSCMVKCVGFSSVTGRGRILLFYLSKTSNKKDTLLKKSHTMLFVFFLQIVLSFISDFFKSNEPSYNKLNLPPIPAWFFKLVDQTLKHAPIRGWTRPSRALAISLSSPVPLDPRLGSCIVNLRGYYVVLCFDRRVSAAGERGRLHKTHS